VSCKTVAAKGEVLMDAGSHQELVALVRERGAAALGTIHQGWPLVSMVLYACTADLSALYIHVSHLAQHTSDLFSHPQVGLMIAEPDRSSRNPLSQARVSIRGTAEPLEADTPLFEAARACYLAAHPSAQFNFQLPGFVLFRIQPDAARFVAGFGKIFDIDRTAWNRLADAPR
jgi:putative heme iron utilization protein